jgi:hypothetical protein
MAQSRERLQQSVKTLERYSACDISDALLRLKVPGAGFVADLTVYHDAHDATGSHHIAGQPEAARPASRKRPKTIAPASTVLFAEKGVAVAWPARNIPDDTHWADLAEPGTVVVIRQPDGQTNAVCGGIMALRMKARQVEGIVTVGRIRDVGELRSTGLSVSSSCCHLSPVSRPLPLHPASPSPFGQPRLLIPANIFFLLPCTLYCLD